MIGSSFMKTLKASSGLNKKSKLSTRQSLATKKSLTAKKPLKATGKTKQKKPMVSKLKKKAWTLFSKVIRYRDGELVGGKWMVECITCGDSKPFSAMQAGHFVSRRYNATLFDWENVNAQCYRCNVMFYGEQYKYSQAIDLKYGDGKADELVARSKVTKQFTVEELEELIADCLTQIDFYEKM